MESSPTCRDTDPTTGSRRRLKERQQVDVIVLNRDSMLGSIAGGGRLGAEAAPRLYGEAAVVYGSATVRPSQLRLGGGVGDEVAADRGGEERARVVRWTSVCVRR
ncbi:uncharacterized protein A4U43_C07F28200 [Asparagus officinalis]|uniref:Uncharacterized protein n=1 Tax=Asparagus officinalis TaxID=4686 RepID=A0A5P1EFU8_ASPOF|nr:uncharacterized protein A4U43_C07F28200 [Asparagus officinalis]